MATVVKLTIILICLSSCRFSKWPNQSLTKLSVIFSCRTLVCVRFVISSVIKGCKTSFSNLTAERQQKSGCIACWPAQLWFRSMGKVKPDNKQLLFFHDHCLLESTHVANVFLSLTSWGQNSERNRVLRHFIYLSIVLYYILTFGPEF